MTISSSVSYRTKVPNAPDIHSFSVCRRHQCNDNTFKCAVPGDGGTQLWANLTGKKTVPHYVCSKTTKDYFNVWLNLELFAPLVIDCWIDNMKCFEDYVQLITPQVQVVIQCDNGHDNKSTRRRHRAA